MCSHSTSLGGATVAVEWLSRLKNWDLSHLCGRFLPRGVWLPESDAASKATFRSFSTLDASCIECAGCATAQRVGCGLEPSHPQEEHKEEAEENELRAGLQRGSTGAELGSGTGSDRRSSTSPCSDGEAKQAVHVGQFTPAGLMPGGKAPGAGPPCSKERKRER